MVQMLLKLINKQIIRKYGLLYTFFLIMQISACYINKYVIFKKMNEVNI